MPHTSQRQADRGEELEHLDRRRRGADVTVLDLVEAELGAQGAKICSSAAATSLGELRGHLLAALLAGAPSTAAASAALVLGALLLGLAASIASRAALSFSQMRGTAKNQVGRTSGRRRAPGAGRGSRDRTRHERQVVVGTALGEVGHRQLRDHAAASGQLDHRRWPRPRRAGCGGSAARPSAARSCRRCRSASARRRAPPAPRPPRGGRVAGPTERLDLVERERAVGSAVGRSTTITRSSRGSCRGPPGTARGRRSTRPRARPRR